MQINDRNRAARNAAALLERDGAMVLSINTQQQRPVIEIAFPTVEMQAKAVEARERIAGGLRTVYLNQKRICGCIVRWSIYSGEEQVEQLVQNMSDYAPELIASWPKNL